MLASSIKKLLTYLLLAVLFVFKLSASDNMIIEDINTEANTSLATTSPETLLNSIQRDPFYRILDQPGWDVTAITDYELSDLVLLAVVWDVPKPVAMFKAPREKRFIVSVGTRIGRNEGRIVSISDGKVHIIESHTGFDGNRIEKSIIKGVGK